MSVLSRLPKAIEAFAMSLTPAGRRHRRMLERLYRQCAAIRSAA